MLLATADPANPHEAVLPWPAGDGVAVLQLRESPVLAALAADGFGRTPRGLRLR